MPQAKMTTTFTLFPEFAALVPLDAIAGPSPTITNFGEIDSTNSFVVNDQAADTDLLVSENGFQFTYTKTSDSVQALDAGGVGDLDDVTTERSLSITMGVNGYSHDIWAILMGLNPKTDINEEFKFLKDDTTGVFAAGPELKGNIKKQKFLFYAVIPLDDTADGKLYIISPKIVVQDQDINLNMQASKVTYDIPLKGLKLLNSSQLSAIQSLAEPVQNGYELLFMFNAANEAYTV